MRFRGNHQQHEKSHLSQARAASLALAWRTCGGGGGTERETGDSQGSRKTFESATGSPPTQQSVCVCSSYLAAEIESLEGRGKKR